MARVSSGGGDPPCTSSGVVSCGAIGVCAAPRFRGGLRLAALAGVADGSRFAPVRRLALVRRLERYVAWSSCAVLRWCGASVESAFSGFSAPSAMLSHVSYASPYLASCPGKHSNKENLHAKRGCEVRGGHQMRVTGTHFAIRWFNAVQRLVHCSSTACYLRRVSVNCGCEKHDSIKDDKASGD